MEPNIELAKPRDFGELISDTFTFIKQNLKPLLKFFFIFCGFFVVATAASTILLAVRAMNLVQSVDPNDFDSQTVFGRFLPLLWVYLLLAVFVILQAVTFNVMVLSFMTIYKQKRNVPPTTEEMWGYIKFYFLRILGSSILLYILLIFGLLFCFIPGIYLAPIFALVPAIMIMENTSFGYAFNQSFKLIRDNWWVTFGVFVVVYIILAVLNYIVNLPATILGAGNLFLHLTSKTSAPLSLTAIVLSAVLQSFTYFFQILLLVAVGLCYYNLSESKEGTSLMERMDEFGKGSTEPGPQPEEY